MVEIATLVTLLAVAAIGVYAHGKAVRP